jgi:hypothetical protein
MGLPCDQQGNHCQFISHLFNMLVRVFSFVDTSTDCFYIPLGISSRLHFQFPALPMTPLY